ncbi:MAG: RpiB/LacA/LacB family sugar-phosphate isomerase [Deltaproteobacteria bacterium]|nr:RpiB/LacA/LacB family sugar-phosphate isomerase [Deltaproteobacteria bacterium]
MRAAVKGRRRLPRLVLAADHGGVALKADLLRRLDGWGYPVRDLGTDTTEPVDYPEYAFAAARAIRLGKADRAILICKSGIGMAICANKSAGVRAALVRTPAEAELSRRHNDANVLVLSANELSARRARRIVETWLSSPFDGGRHRRRIGKIRRYEKAHWKDQAPRIH